MKRLIAKTKLIFGVDLLLSTLSSAASILLFRFFSSAFPNFFQLFLLWVGGSVVCSLIALPISKIHRILFSYARFKSVGNILSFAFIKDLLLAIVFCILDTELQGMILMVIMSDFLFTFISITWAKLLILRLIEEEEEEEEEGEEKEKREDIDKLRVVIFGTSPKSISVVTRYEQSNNYIIKGFITHDQNLNGNIIMGYPVYALPDDLTDFKIPDVEAVLFAVHEEFAHEQYVVRECDKRGICVLHLPSVQITNYPGFELKEIKHVLDAQFIPDHMSSVGRAVKRFTDLVISGILIIIFSPMMLVISIILKISEGSPVIFRQERIGRFGRPFNILKFRTMRLDAEANGPALYAGEDDPRMTKVGKFLRAHHLDEMPQLFNVFVGEMSFVGYRPERKVYIDKIVEKDPRYAYLYQIRPGVTSYATLRNGYTDNLEKMLRRLKFDLYYLNHRSFFFDMKVLWDTFANIAFGKKF